MQDERTLRKISKSGIADFRLKTRDINDLLPEFYLLGLAPGDSDEALRGLSREDAWVSASIVARLKE